MCALPVCRPFPHAGRRGVKHHVDEGAGRPLSMVDGNPTWSFYWRRLIERFRSTHRVVAVDHIGCGLSDKPQDHSHYSLQRHIANLVEVVDQLNLAARCSAAA